MGQIRNAMMGLIVLSVFAVACQKSSDRLAQVGDGSGKNGPQKPQEDPASTKPKTTEELKSDLAKMAPADQAFLKAVSTDMLQLAHMTTQMDALYYQILDGYMKVQYGSVAEKNKNIFHTLKLAVKTNFDMSSGLPLKGLAGVTSQKLEEQKKAETAPQQQGHSGDQKQGQKNQPSQAPSARGRGGRGGAAPQQARPQNNQAKSAPQQAACVETMSIEVTNQYKNAENFAVPRIYEVSRLTCSGGVQSKTAIAEVHVKAWLNEKNERSRFLRIYFKNLGALTHEMGNWMPLSNVAPKSIVSQKIGMIEGEAQEAYLIPGCMVFSDAEKRPEFVRCIGIGSTTKDEHFVMFDPLDYKRASGGNVSGQLVEISAQMAEGSMKFVPDSRKKLMDEVMKDFVFQEVEYNPPVKEAAPTAPQAPAAPAQAPSAPATEVPVPAIPGEEGQQQPVKPAQPTGVQGAEQNGSPADGQVQQVEQELDAQGNPIPLEEVPL